MIRAAMSLAAGAVLLPLAAAAQVLPMPEPVNPRLQTVKWEDGRQVILTALPRTALTVVLEPGEAIERVALGDQGAIAVQVSAEGDSFTVVPRAETEGVALMVETNRRSYPFNVRTGTGLLAAYLVRFTYGDQPALQPPEITTSPEPTGQLWAYRLKGDRSVRPSAISDDGVRTTIEFAADQPLPAVFAAAPNGGEEVVNGYMRDDRFVIDRVYPELVFRIDKARSVARRAERAEPSQ